MEFDPLIRKVKTECEREDRSFMRVAATVRRDCARRSRDRTCAGDSRGTIKEIRMEERRYSGIHTNYNVSDSGGTFVVLNLMLLFVELTTTE